MDNKEITFLKHVIEGPIVLGKIDLSKVDSSTRPKSLPLKKVNRFIQLRDRLDSGWGWSFNQLKRNYHSQQKQQTNGQ